MTDPTNEQIDKEVVSLITAVMEKHIEPRSPLDSLSAIPICGSHLECPGLSTTITTGTKLCRVELECQPIRRSESNIGRTRKAAPLVESCIVNLPTIGR